MTSASVAWYEVQEARVLGARRVQDKIRTQDSEEEVNHDPEFLLKENEELHALIENSDDVLRMAKKKRKGLRAEIEERGEMIGDLESKLLDAKIEIESLKSTPTISDELVCSDCDVFHGELKELREKYASRIDEIDRLKVELVELKSRPALLGACTSCPVLHAKLNESLEHAKSLESALKSSAAIT